MENRTSKPKLDQLAGRVVAGWLVPGLGHILAGHRRTGSYLLALVGGTFVLGAIASDFEAVSRDLHPVAMWAQMGVGAGALPLLALDPASSRVLEPQAAIARYEDVSPLNDVGVLFCSIAGLLNLLIVFDLLDRALEPDRRRREREAAVS
ncbi:MAG: DUF6677 family protein [Planctomycetota bacterium]